VCVCVCGGGGGGGGGEAFVGRGENKRLSGETGVKDSRNRRSV